MALSVIATLGCIIAGVWWTEAVLEGNSTQFGHYVYFHNKWRIFAALVMGWIFFGVLIYLSWTEY